MNASNFFYIESNKKANEAVEYLSQFSRLGYDTETTGLDIISKKSKLLLMQLGTEEAAYVFDARRIDTSILRPILESKSIVKILHNAKFDYQSTKINTGITLTNMFDTMLAYRILTCGKDDIVGMREKNKRKFPYKSLNFLCNKYLGINLDKDVRKTFVNFQYNREFTESQLKYAAEDILVLQPICDILSDELIKEGLLDTAILEFAFIKPCSEMEMAGIQINQKKWREVIASAETKANFYFDKLTEELSVLSDQNTLFGATTINIDSNDQIMECFRKLGIQLESTEKKFLKNCKHPVADMVSQYRAYKKLMSTYGEGLLKKINKNTGRLHYTLHQLGADTGRLSSDSPNIQNIPQDREDEEVQLSFRECFEASPGKMILTADYSQCELRILAEVSQDKGFLSIFHNNQDLHQMTAQEVFGFSDEDLVIFKRVKKLDESGCLSEATPEEIKVYKMVGDYRQKTKAINFGIPYGISAYSLADRFRVPKEEAQDILDGYFRTYSGIKKWLDKNGHLCLVNRYSKTLLGRKRYYYLPDLSDEEVFRRAKGATLRMGNNQVIQGTNADITKAALVALQEYYDSISGAHLLFTVHDEVVSEVDEDKAEEVAVRKAEIMRDAFHRFIKTVPVGVNDRVGVSIKKFWSK